MGDIRDRVQRARRQVMEEAFARWVQRWRTREEHRTLVATQGPGAADPPQRRAAFQAREARRAALGLTRAVERMVGQTWDATFFAPSDAARAAARPVARLVEWAGEGFQPQGVATGFLVSPDLLLTNWHVIPERSCANGMHANFGHERTERGTAAGSLFALEPDRFFLAHERLDFALIAVRRAGAVGEQLDAIPPIRLIGGLGKIRTGDPMNVIQHPGGDARQYAVRNNRLVDILEADGFLHYESDTLQGSSGSPVFNTSWELVGLHHCGVPAMRGSEIVRKDGTAWDPESDDEDDIEWVANEGARVSFIVAALREMRADSATEQGLLDALLATVGDPLGPGTPAPAHVGPAALMPPAEGALTRAGSPPGLTPPSAVPPFTPPEPSMSANVFNITGSTVTIHVGAQPPAVAPTPAVSAAPTPAPSAEHLRFVEKAQNFDPDYTARPGYDPEFLGVEIPLPEVDAARRGDLYTVANYREFLESARTVPEIDTGGMADDAPFLLDYHHYSLVTNRVLRIAMFTASNADYSDEAREDPREREAFGGESWRLDPRVPKQYQLVNADIYGPARNLDRGHLVRREDSAWGAPGLDTEFANADTYHWTNCTPQHELFNQEHPKGQEYRGRTGIWGEFEAQLQAELMNGGGQATIFAGPVLYADTRRENFGRGEVVYPLKFWKVVVVPKSRGRRPALAAYGFVFDQSRALREFGLGLEALELRRFFRQAKPLAEIEALSGVRLSDVVRRADQHT